MVIIKTQTYPGMRNGYFCAGVVNTDTGGVGSITFTGPDVSAKICGLHLTPRIAAATTAKMYSAYPVSIAFSAGVTTIVIQANQIVDSGSGTTDLSAFDGDVDYSFFVSDTALPTDSTTNVPGNTNI